MKRPSWVYVVLGAMAAVLFVFASVAAAQHSGGSFGGGDFGGGGGGYGGGGYGGGGYGGGGYGGGSYHGSVGPALGLIRLGIEHPPLGIAMLAVLAIVLFMRSMANSGGSSLPGPQARAWMNVDVTAVRIAVDAESREFIQRELAKIATRSTRGPAALLESLQRVVRLLRKCDAAWIYGGASNYHPMSPPVAEGVFKRHAQEARSKFQNELVRNADGQLVTQKSAGYAARASEGEGVALVTLVVAARREIRDFYGNQRSEIAAVLADLDRLTPGELVAMEVVWMPADEADRISSATLEALCPDLVKLPPMAGREGRPVGRVHCAYCRGPFAAELPTCPHCGAPAPGSTT